MKMYTEEQLKDALKNIIVEHPDLDISKLTKRQILAGTLGWLIQHDVTPEGEEYVNDEWNKSEG